MAAYYKVEVSLGTNAVEVGIPSPQSVNVVLPLVGPQGATGATGATGPEGPVGPAGPTDFNELTNVPASFTPSAHAASHATGGSDPVSAFSIGADSRFESETQTLSGDITLTASRAKIWVLNILANRTVTLPDTGVEFGDRLVVRGGSPTLGTLTLTSTAVSDTITFTDQQLSYVYSSTGSGPRWVKNSVDVHTHAAADITDFTAAVEAVAPSTTDASLLTSGTLNDARLSSAVTTSLGKADTASQPGHTHTPTEVGLGNVTNAAQVTGVTGTFPIVSSGGTTPAISILTATTSLPGAMSASDKTKLDGIAAATATPQALGTAAAGTSADYARADHVHGMPDIGDLGDVSISNIGDRALLQYDAATQTWSNNDLGTIFQETEDAASDLGLAPVASSGDYNDLDNKPTLGTAATEDFAAPPAIGSTTPAAGSFTTLTGSTQIVGPQGFNSGSTSAPAISLGATNTGIYVAGGQLAFVQNGVLRGYFDNSSRFVIASGGGLTFQGGSIIRLGNTIFRTGVDSGTAELHNTTTPQGFRIYNTFTSDTNFERLNLRWASNEFIFDTEADGTGTLRGIKIGSATSSLLGFYGVTPVDQPATVADPSGVTTDEDVEARTAINAIIDRLQELGLVA